MSKTDPRVDEYIASSADFAKPILTYIRSVVHESCPDVEEAMKWSNPHFLYKGMLCSMASFKEHCVFGFWKGSLVVGDGTNNQSAGHFWRLTRTSDLPSRKVLGGYIRKAMALNDDEVKVVRAPRPASARLLTVPSDLKAALNENTRARKAFEAFSPSHRNEYVEWITEAKRDETRSRRIKTAMEWITKGKSRNWKYQ